MRVDGRADSDVDIAVYLSDDVDESRYLPLSLDLAGQLAHRTGVEPIAGVVVLNEAPLRARFRVPRARTGPPTAGQDG